MTDVPIKAGVVLLNWNTGEYTLRCIESLYQGTLQPWKIVVFDNGSTDGSPEQIMTSFPNIELIRSPSNQGFAAPNNQAAQLLLRQGAQYVWFLNNDTRVARGCLEALGQALQSDPTIAAASGKILYMQAPDVIQYAGAFWHRVALRAPFRGSGEHDAGQYDSPCDVGLLSGCCLFVRADVWQQLGGFRENYFAYNEDTEWCLRATRMGLRLRYVPSAVLWHAQHASMRKNFGIGHLLIKAAPHQEYLQTRNSIFLNREHAGRRWQLMVSLTDNVMRRLYRATGLLVLGRWKSSLAILKGLYDGFRLPYR